MWSWAARTRTSTCCCGRELQRHYGQKPQIVLMTPILEGLDGVQKMSKSLGNAIGINEPPAEMYGKLMSITDELMWKYWLFLTDLKQSEIDGAAGRSGRGQAASDGGEEAAGADDYGGISWRGRSRRARMRTGRGCFSRKETAKDLEEVCRLPYVWKWLARNHNQIRVAKLLVQLGLAASGARGQPQDCRKGRETRRRSGRQMRWFRWTSLPARIVVRLGKRAKIALIA